MIDRVKKTLSTQGVYIILLGLIIAIIFEVLFILEVDLYSKEYWFFGGFLIGISIFFIGLLHNQQIYADEYNKQISKHR